MSLSSTKGQATRELILRAAAVEFRARGYEAATLEGIAGGLGITRQAVLYHFATKEELLDGVVTPFLTGMRELLDRFDSVAVGSVQSRRQLISEAIDLTISDPLAAGIVFRDVTSWKYARVGSRAAESSQRFRTAMVGDLLGLGGQTLAASLLGALVRPIVEAELDKTDPEFRRAILDATFAIADLIDARSELLRVRDQPTRPVM